MEVLRIKKGDVIAKQRENVKEWYIIQEGTVVVKYDMLETKLGPNSIIGILEQDWFMCDYIASTDVTMFVFPCSGANDLKKFLAAEPKMRKLFLRTSMVQRHQLLCIYVDYLTKIREYQHFVDNVFNEYNLICAQYKLADFSGSRIETLKPLEMVHRAENWEVGNSNSLIKNYLDEYLNLLIKDENLCVGAIMEASAQLHRVARGVGEMVAYIKYNRDILISARQGDLFHALYDLKTAIIRNDLDTKEVDALVQQLFVFAEKINVYDASFLDKCKQLYEACAEEDPDDSNTQNEDDMMFILKYSGYNTAESKSIYSIIMNYKNAISSSGKEEEAYQLRKQINTLFYDWYEKCFFVAVEDDNIPTAILMFLNFGYVGDVMIGDEKTIQLYELASHLELCKSDHVFTIFEWLKAVYRGDKMPSKNEFDLDYLGHLTSLLKDGTLTKSDVEYKKNDMRQRVSFEINNMFKSVNRVTYGNFLSFCPVLSESDLFNNIEKMLMTVKRIEHALDEIRKVDYSAFYRPLSNHGLQAEMMHEQLMTEILPDVILMPNAGTKAMMWQETASVRNDTPARFMFPIFTVSDEMDMMVELTGRYRWEMCRKIQGVHWNDISDHSLTSEYCDYLQFYRKNRELSGDTREQIKTALVRAKNNFREVFVRDYQNYIKYEAKGGFRLNKYVRRIIFAYCPFSVEIRDELKSNPMFAESVLKHEVAMKQNRKRLEGLYDKYKQGDNEITAEMKENLHYYQM